jgi:hypothetical protein
VLMVKHPVWWRDLWTVDGPPAGFPPTRLETKFQIQSAPA